MYANVLNGVKQGVMTKHVVPRFPDTIAEVYRLLGFTPSIVRAYTCQEASGDLVDLSGTTDLVPQSGPLYRTPVMGIQEYGGGSRSGIVSHGWVRLDNAVKPGTASFLMMYYGNYTNGGGSNPNVGFGVMDNADGAQLIRVFPTDGSEASWVSQCRDDALNDKVMTGLSSPIDRVARGTALMYDAGAATLSICSTGERQYTNAMGTWTGLGAGTALPTMFVGHWPGVVGSDLNTRYALIAHGAQLDNQGVNLAAIMRRFGWQ